MNVSSVAAVDRSPDTAVARRCICQSVDLDLVHGFDSPPPGETPFELPEGRRYRRELMRCRQCGHFLGVHELAAAGFYNASYVDATYGDDGIRRRFDRIAQLDCSASDNARRARRVTAFAHRHFFEDGPQQRQLTLLDIGSGIGVFPHAMKAAGFQCTALDPDARAVGHARDHVGVEAIHADYMRVDDIGQFDVISFNKVLEHVIDPIAMLTRSRRHLSPGGFVYVEVPDGETAIEEGPERQEFFCEHYHAFSRASLRVLGERSGYVLRVQEQLQEPSGKYTLRAMLVDESTSNSSGDLPPRR